MFQVKCLKKEHFLYTQHDVCPVIVLTNVCHRIYVRAMEDHLLIHRCKCGNIDALALIYDKYKSDLILLAVSLLNDSAAGEDVVHDVFVKFAGSIRLFDLTGSLKGYLMTCVANRARDVLRREHPRGQVISYDQVDTTEPVDRVICNEKAHALAQAMEQLPYDQREIVLLHIQGGIPLQTIARNVKMSPNTVKSRYRYGLNKLRDILNGQVNHER